MGGWVGSKAHPVTSGLLHTTLNSLSRIAADNDLLRLSKSLSYRVRH